MRRHPRPPMGMPGMGPPGMGPPPLRPPRGPLPPPMAHGPRGPRHAPGLPIPRPGPGAMGPPPPVAVSSCTNSNDPASMDSRLFVGNLNTLVLSKESIEGIFSRYGLVTGISMHKGYAFVQFSHPDEARRAGASEDGKIYAGQAIDINIVSQPKNRNALKRSTSGRAVNDANIAPKKPRNDTAPTNQSLQRTLVTLSGNAEPNNTKRVAANNAVKKAIATVAKKSVGKPATAIAKVTSVSKPAVVKPNWPDVLICGICKLQFTSLHSLAQHKKVPCGLRVSTQAKDDLKAAESNGEPVMLMCATCDAEFNTAWALCQHCTEEHKIKIYKTQLDESAEKKGSCDIKTEIA